MNAYIIAGLRSPVGKASKGMFRFLRPDDLAAQVIKQVLAQVPNLDKEKIDDVIVGNAMPEAEQGLNLAKFNPCSASGIAFPTITSSIFSLSRFGTCARTCLITCAARSSGRRKRNIPLEAFPTGERSPAIIYAFIFLDLRY